MLSAGRLMGFFSRKKKVDKDVYSEANTPDKQRAHRGHPAGIGDTPQAGPRPVQRRNGQRGSYDEYEPYGGPVPEVGLPPPPPPEDSRVERPWKKEQSGGGSGKLRRQANPDASTYEPNTYEPPPSTWQQQAHPAMYSGTPTVKTQ